MGKLSLAPKKIGVSPGMHPSQGYNGMHRWPGLTRMGNIDLSNRQIVDFPNGMDESNSTPEARKTVNGEDFPPGSYGSEYSMTIRDGNDAVLIPSIYNGMLHSTKEATQHYYDSKAWTNNEGEHMGKFNQAQDEANGQMGSDSYATLLHQRPLYVNGQLYQGAGTAQGAGPTDNGSGTGVAPAFSLTGGIRNNPTDGGELWAN